MENEWVIRGLVALAPIVIFTMVYTFTAIRFSRSWTKQFWMYFYRAIKSVWKSLLISSAFTTMAVFVVRCKRCSALYSQESLGEDFALYAFIAIASLIYAIAISPWLEYQREND